MKNVIEFKDGWTATKTKKGWKLTSPDQGYSSRMKMFVSGSTRDATYFCLERPLSNPDGSWNGQYDLILNPGYIIK